ncbi:type II secretion system protein [Candidatus Uhrbacteria bacterium]|nr:type II secretion system protein [Candidatus Uhrbacteria bacterium]
MRSVLKKGFTVLELLVVIAIIGILAAVSVYSLSITRASNRDAKRISDIAVMRAALSQHWLQKATYPQSEKVDLGRQGAEADKLTGNGFVAANIDAKPVFLLQVPLGPKAGEYYTYHGDNQGYSLRFVTERPTAYGAPGVYYGHSDGVDTVDELH